MTTDIKCECGTLFGKEETAEGRTTLAIKYRDLFRTIDGGLVMGPCRGCGKTVLWQSRRVNAK